MSYITQDLSKADCTLAAGVFTVTLPSVCKVVLPSTTAGANASIDLGGKTYTIQDDSHGSSHLGALGFGITETADWANDMPFFIYLVNEDNTAANVGLFVTRSPCMAVTPAATYIHDKTAAAANDTQASILGAWADDAGKAAKPCILIGAIRMRWSTTTDDWTIQVLGNNDGIGQDRIDKTLSTTWTFPVGQNGNMPSKYFTTGSMTALAFTINVASYLLSKEGICSYSLKLNVRSAAGDNHEQLVFRLPFTSNAATNITEYGAGTSCIANTQALIVSTIASGQVYAILNSNTTRYLYDHDFSHANDNIMVTNAYKAF